MYFVDQDLLEQRLQYIQSVLEHAEQYEGIPVTMLHQLAFERAIHMSIEAILDVGNQMIDGFIMRDPGSYEDIIIILGDEDVLTHNDVKLITGYIKQRKWLMTHYTESTVEDLWHVFHRSKESLKAFPDRIRTYIRTQLGPVSAFKPKE
ncbi:DUF86 domain-containing protein [Caldalkalibacillus salinus]|uniref:DUF86 domain-containing protein n=1 Tax=Caldalkalibacillus salinus TaxID=2803787 RepID=UPI001923EB54|nr:DUF86 domain-containing protein [Caldalkalibacillus salinus]